MPTKIEGDDIGARVAQGHLTYYYPTRRDLLKTVAGAVTASLLDEFRSVAAGEEPAIRNMFRGLNRAIRTQLAEWLHAATKEIGTALAAAFGALRAASKARPKASSKPARRRP